MMNPLKKWRQDNGISLAQAGAALGVSGECFRRYENGQRDLDMSMLITIERKLGVSPSEIIDFFKNHHPPPASPIA